MKPVNLALTVTFAIIALGVTVWLGKYRGTIPVVEAPAKPTYAVDGELPIAPEGPYGSAVAAETHFDFGVLEQGSKGSHTFTIKNEGPGPLRVKHGQTSCGQCTFGKVVPEDEDIPPGGTAEVQINWEIKNPTSRFRQSADVHTNDPEKRKIVFTIQGTVDTFLRLIPEGTWMLGDLAESEPTVIEGHLYSSVLDEITIDRVECANPLVNVTWEPDDAALLAEKKARSGLKIKVTIAPGSTIGPLRETVKLITPVRGGTTMEFGLSGQRPGPIEVKGRGFNSENNLAALGEFPAARGARAKLMMYVRNLEGDLEVQQVEAEGGRAKVRVAPQGKTFGKARIFEVDVEVPPGPPSMRRSKNAEPIVLKLNHPTVSEFKMYVDYHAR